MVTVVLSCLFFVLFSSCCSIILLLVWLSVFVVLIGDGAVIWVHGGLGGGVGRWRERVTGLFSC